jgi:hypothetical protein
MSGFGTLVITFLVEIVLLPFAIRERMRARSTAREPDARRHAKWPERPK